MFFQGYEINGKITAVQRESELTTKSMNTTTEEVTRAHEYIKEVGEALAKINDSVRGAGDQISQIATAVEQQSAVAKEVAKNIETTLSISKETDDISRLSSKALTVHFFGERSSVFFRYFTFTINCRVMTCPSCFVSPNITYRPLDGNTTSVWIAGPKWAGTASDICMLISISPFML